MLASVGMWATVHNVSVGSNFFNPASLTINQGDTVVWTNTGGNHNVDGTDVTNPVSFINGPASSSAWTYQYIFTVPGTYNYVCTPHAPGMAGSVTVNAVAQVAPLAQSFETSGGTWNFTINPASYNASGDIWDTVSSLSSINPSEGSAFWGMQDLDNPNGGGAFPHTMDFNVVDISSLANGVVSFDYYTIGFETSDTIGYFIEFDNGTTWTNYTALNQDSQGWITITETIPSTATYVRVRIHAVQNGGSDYAAVDNFTVGEPVAPAGGIPTYTISQIHGEDANGEADSLNVECRLTGVVYSIDFDGNAGYNLFMQDETGGINVYSTSDLGTYTTPMVGDSIRVIGSLDQFNGLLEIIPDSIVVLNTGVAVAAPTQAYIVDESNEGMYTKLNGYWLVDATQWPASGSANVTITNGTDTLTMRIDSDTDIDGSPAPTGVFSVVGAAGQFDGSSPYTTGYQILPSSLADFTPAAASTIPVFDIADVTTNDAAGVADSVGVYCELRGTVFTTDFDSNNGYSLYMYDGTGGINIYKWDDVNNYTMPQVGDSIRAFGSIVQFRGLTELEVDSIILVGTNKTLVAPMVVSMLDESTESEFIQLNGWSLVDATQWPTSAGSSANVDITNGTDTLLMRIDSDTDIDGTPAPTTSFDVFGAGSQYSSSNSAYLDGYQFFPSSIADFTFAAPTTPTVNFLVSSQTEREDVGTITVEVNINPVPAGAETIYLTAVLGANVDPATDGFITPMPNLTTGFFQIPVAANADSTGFTITILDDAVIEGNETLFVNIDSVSSGLLTGTNTSYQIIIEDNDAVIPSFNIADITTSDANGVADSLNVSGMIEGVVYTDDFDGNSGYSFFIYDNTGGINVFEYDDLASGFQVNRGDSIRVYGWVDQYNGLIEFRPDSIEVLATGVALKMPAVVTALDESTEGEYIRLNGFTVVDTAQWPISGSSATIAITNGTDTIDVRIDSDTDIDGSPVPTGVFDIIGAGSQFTFNTPPVDGYQIQPRDINDIIWVPATVKLAITEVMPGSDHGDTATDGDWFEVTNYGTTAVDMAGFSWDDDSRDSGNHYISTSFTVNAGESVIFLDEHSINGAAWLTTWRQDSTLKIVFTDDFGGIDFSGLGKGGDEVNLYDADSNLVSRAAYSSSVDGYSVEFDTLGNVIGNAVDGVNGAYTSNFGDVGSPGNQNPISVREFFANEYNVYPVPAHTILTLETETNARKEVVLTSVSGVVVYRSVSTEEKLNISVADLPRGIYVLSFESEGRRASRKVIVQ